MDPQLFDIGEDTYQVATLEVLSTTEINHRLTSFNTVGSIRFELFGVECTLSYMEFTLFMGLYNSEFVTTHAYDQLLINYLRG